MGSLVGANEFHWRQLVDHVELFGELFDLLVFLKGTFFRFSLGGTVCDLFVGFFLAAFALFLFLWRSWFSLLGSIFVSNEAEFFVNEFQGLLVNGAITKLTREVVRVDGLASLLFLLLFD